VHIECKLHTMVSKHTWQFATSAFSQALPWLAERLAAAEPA
jgi:S-formylglutathione hydrolase FrmB